MAFLKVILVIVLAFVSIPEASSSAQPRNVENALHDDPIPRHVPVIGPNTKLNHALGNNQEARSSAQARSEQSALHDDTIPRQVIGPNTKLNHALGNNQDASSSSQPRNVENGLCEDTILNLKRQNMGLKAKLKQALRNNQEASSSAQSSNVENAPRDDTIMDLKAETEHLRRQNMGLKTKLKQSLRNNLAYIQGALQAANRVYAPTRDTNCLRNWTDTQALVSGERYWVQDCDITVSSRWSSQLDGYCGRINATINPTCQSWATWIPLTSDTDPWIEATFLPLARFVVTAITTRGFRRDSRFVTEYKLGFRINKDIILYLDEAGDHKIFARPLRDEITHDLDPFIVYARSIILFPVRWTGAEGFKFRFAWEIHGYPMVE